MKNWKTTLLGVITILIAAGGAAKALLDGDPSTNPDLMALTAAVTAGWGLITAKDASTN